MKAMLPLLFVLPLAADAQTIELDWPNSPCATLLHCDSGCTACNLPVNSSSAFNGTGLARIGVDVCPVADGGGDNILATYGWSSGIDSTRALLLSAIALQPMHIDSVIIRHRTSTDGPGTVRLAWSVNNAPLGTLMEFTTSEGVVDEVLTDIGTVSAEAGMAYGFLQFQIQAFGSAAGAWYLDEVRIVATPVAPTGIAEFGVAPGTRIAAPVVDVLGRPVGDNVAPGAYVNGSRRVYVP